MHIAQPVAGVQRVLLVQRDLVIISTVLMLLIVVPVMALTVLFAWRWPRPGPHTIAFASGVANGKEGAGFLHLRAYLIDP